MSVAHHTVVDVEAVTDPTIPAKEGSEDQRFDPAVRWEVVAIGCFSFADYAPESFGCIRGATEREKIAAYVGHVERDHPVIVTWNGRFFDGPVLGMRALRFALSMPSWYGAVRGPRYRYGDKAIDVKDHLADFGATMTPSQNQVARLIGFPGKGETTGAQVGELHAKGDHASIERYCLDDVAQLAAIWLRYELLRGTLKPREWPKLAEALLAFLARRPEVAEMIAKVDREIFVEGLAKGQRSLTR